MDFLSKLFWIDVFIIFVVVLYTELYHKNKQVWINPVNERSLKNMLTVGNSLPLKHKVYIKKGL